jgi:hypothetical protein
MAPSSVWPLIHGEREALAADLAGLTESPHRQQAPDRRARPAGQRPRVGDRERARGDRPGDLPADGDDRPRRDALDDLSGEGVATLRSRI